MWKRNKKGTQYPHSLHGDLFTVAASDKPKLRRGDTGGIRSTIMSM
jgi:hypothetical protein